MNGLNEDEANVENIIYNENGNVTEQILAKYKQWIIIVLSVKTSGDVHRKSSTTERCCL